jgi:hypothetical protein
MTVCQLFRKALFFTLFFINVETLVGNNYDRNFTPRFELNCLKIVLNFNSCEERTTFEV